MGGQSTGVGMILGSLRVECGQLSEIYSYRFGQKHAPPTHTPWFHLDSIPALASINYKKCRQTPLPHHASAPSSRKPNSGHCCLVAQQMAAAINLILLKFRLGDRKRAGHGGWVRGSLDLRVTGRQIPLDFLQILLRNQDSFPDTSTAALRL